MELYSIYSSTSIFGFSTMQYIIVRRGKCVFLGIDALVYLVCLFYSVICFSSVLLVSWMLFFLGLQGSYLWILYVLVYFVSGVS